METRPIKIKTILKHWMKIRIQTPHPVERNVEAAIDNPETAMEAADDDVDNSTLSLAVCTEQVYVHT